MPSTSPTLLLRVHSTGQNSNRTTTHTFSQNIIKIGKLASSHLAIPHDSVSRMHAVLEVEKNRIVLTDLGSKQGSYLRGKKIAKAEISHGDTLVLGEVKISVEIPSSPAATATEQAPLPAPKDIYPTGDVEAVSVQSYFGDTLLQSKYLKKSHSSRPWKSPRLFAGLAFLFLLLSLFSFRAGLQTATSNKAALAKHIASGKAHYDFRPKTLSGLHDFIAIGGLALGLFCAAAALVSRRTEKNSQEFKIGSDKRCDFPTDDIGCASHALIEQVGNQWQVNLRANWVGRVSEAGVMRDFSESIRLNSDTRVELQVGQQRFAITPSLAPKATAMALWKVDTQLAGYLAGSAIALLSLLGLLRSLEADQSTYYSDNNLGIDRMARLKSVPNEAAVKEPETGAEQGSTEESSSSSGGKAAGESGKMGRPEVEASSGRYAIKDRGLPPSVARQQAIEVAKHSGIMGLMAARQTSFATLAGQSDFSSGLDDYDIYGNYSGSDFGEATGAWGSGESGIGPGGGCTHNCGVIGAGDYDIIGDGSDPSGKPGRGPKGDGDSLKRHRSKSPEVTVGIPKQDGDLDASIIRRHVRKQLRRIQHCYERQLIAQPKLKGTVDVQFQIAPNGSVQSARAKGMGSGKVESCVAGVIKTIKFPAPENGSYVLVRSYPFTFRPAGD